MYRKIMFDGSVFKVLRKGGVGLYREDVEDSMPQEREREERKQPGRVSV